MGNDAVASARKIIEVRDRAGVALADAKRALVAANGDVAEAVRSFMTPEAAARDRADERRRLAPPPAPILPATRDPVAWLRAQLDDNAVPDVLEQGEVGRRVEALASAVRALEAGSSVFGMHVTPALAAEIHPLAAYARELLARWQARLITEIGVDECQQFMRTIAGRARIRLDGVERASDELDRAVVTPAAQHVLDVLRTTLGDHERLDSRWRAEGRLEDSDIVIVRVGAPDGEQLALLADEYAATIGHALPAFYARLLATYNGVEVGTNAPGATAFTTVPARELGEPLLWPASIAKPLELADVSLDGITTAFVLGSLPDSGYLVFDADAADRHDAPVFWVPRRFASERPTRLASSIAELVLLLCTHALDLPGVLKACRVPGWGG